MESTTIAPQPTTAADPPASAQPPTTAINNAPEKTAPKPRDARLIHALLSSQGISAYQERVPLMLADFAYRYTRSILSDAANLAAEGYGALPSTSTSKKGGDTKDDDISMTALRLAVASRQITQFQPLVGKHDLLEMAGETNKVGLPRVEREFGVRLPSERYLFTGGAWQLMEEWEDDVEVDEMVHNGQVVGEGEGGDTVMVDGEDGDEDILDGGMGDEDEDEFNEVMGNSAGGGDGSQDQTMGGT